MNDVSGTTWYIGSLLSLSHWNTQSIDKTILLKLVIIRTIFNRWILELYNHTKLNQYHNKLTKQGISN
jgi:hypothetical protein